MAQGPDCRFRLNPSCVVGVRNHQIRQQEGAHGSSRQGLRQSGNDVHSILDVLSEKARPVVVSDSLHGCFKARVGYVV